MEENLLHIIQQIDHVTMKDGPKYVVLELREGVYFLGVGGVHGEAETSRNQWLLIPTPILGPCIPPTVPTPGPVFKDAALRE